MTEQKQNKDIEKETSNLDLRKDYKFSIILPERLKAESVKWVKKDAKDINKFKDMSAGELLGRWIFRFNLTLEEKNK